MMAAHRRAAHIAVVTPLLLLLCACGQSQGASSGGSPAATLTPHGTPSQPTPELTPPPGWSVILAGLRFTNTSARGALVASSAQSGRVIGCGTSVPLSQPPEPPSFVLSDDGGQTWKTRAIPNLPPAIGCTVFADTLQPDTFALMLSNSVGAPIHVTKDAGVTWRALKLPTDGITPTAIALVGGRLFSVMNPSGANSWQLMQLALDTGSWRTLNQSLPNSQYIPLAAAVDPEQPTTIYMDGAIGSTLTIYRSLDMGISWQAVVSMPTAHHVAINTLSHHRVVVEQQDGLDTPTPLQYSSDRGASWQGIAMHYNGGGESLFISPQGRIFTATGADAATSVLYELDPVRGAFSPLGSYTLGSGAPVVAVVDGTAPALLYATSDHVWRLPLKG
jgi:hypothetical protein